MAFTLPVVLSFSICISSLTSFPAAIHTTCWPTWQRGRADMSPEQEHFNLAQTYPPGSCAGVSSSCAVKIEPCGEGTQVWCWGCCEGAPVPLWPCGWAGSTPGRGLHPKTLTPRPPCSGRVVKTIQTIIFCSRVSKILGLHLLMMAATCNRVATAALAGIWTPLANGCTAPGHESHSTLIRTDVTHQNTMDLMQQKCHGLF